MWADKCSANFIVTMSSNAGFQSQSRYLFFSLSLPLRLSMCVRHRSTRLRRAIVYLVCVKIPKWLFNSMAIWPFLSTSILVVRLLVGLFLLLIDLYNCVFTLLWRSGVFVNGNDACLHAWHLHANEEEEKQNERGKKTQINNCINLNKNFTQNQFW